MREESECSVLSVKDVVASVIAFAILSRVKNFQCARKPCISRPIGVLSCRITIKMKEILVRLVLCSRAMSCWAGGLLLLLVRTFNWPCLTLRASLFARQQRRSSPRVSPVASPRFLGAQPGAPITNKFFFCRRFKSHSGVVPLGWPRCPLLAALQRLCLRGSWDGKGGSTFCRFGFGFGGSGFPPRWAVGGWRARVLKM